jgi:phage terminase large subunit-like protein
VSRGDEDNKLPDELELEFERQMRAAEELSATLVGPSLADELITLPSEDVEEILDSLTVLDRARLMYAWEFWARPKQRWPADANASVFFFLAGRGCGKSRSGAEWIRECVYAGVRMIALVGPTHKDIRRYMLGGKSGKKGNGSGILDVFPAHQRPRFFEQKGEVHFHTGAVAIIHSAEDPEFRGANLEATWCDEIVKWQNAEKLWDNIEMTMRVDGDFIPRIMVTSTGDDLPVIKKIIADPETLTILADTEENATNVAARWKRKMYRKYGGDEVGQRELKGGIFSAGAGKLFNMATITKHRVTEAQPLRRIAVSIDPAQSTLDRNDDTGIVAAGVGRNDHLYVLRDRTGKYAPEEWGDIVVDLLDELGASTVLVERNRGGDMAAANVRAAIKNRVRDGNMTQARAAAIRFVEVTARGDKGERAEPVSALYVNGFVHHVGQLPRLEREMTTWKWKGRAKSPNGLDALTQAADELLGLNADAKLSGADACIGLAKLNEIERPKNPRYNPLGMSGAGDAEYEPRL